jgi:pimeloyl-ACP methyl ester carboxylesterase
MRKAAVILGFAVALIALILVMLRTPDSDAASMRVKYGGPDSVFARTPDGMSVHYRDQGCRDCPAILLVHGSNSSLQTFEPLVRNLQNRYRLISYDQPGHGLTGPHPRDDYSAQGMFEAIAAVVEATGVERFAIAGNSMGGWVAWRYALAQPQNVSALVLIDSAGAPAPPGAEKPRLYLGARIMRWSVGRLLGQLVTPRPVIRQSLLDSVADEAGVTEEMVDRYWELLRFPGNRRAAGLLAIVDREPGYGKRLSEVNAPTLILWGEEDRVIPPDNAKIFHQMIPDSSLQIFDGVGHLPMEEAPERTASAIDRFFNEIQTSKKSRERG